MIASENDYVVGRLVGYLTGRRVEWYKFTEKHLNYEFEPSIATIETALEFLLNISTANKILDHDIDQEMIDTCRWMKENGLTKEKILQLLELERVYAQVTGGNNV